MSQLFADLGTEYGMRDRRPTTFTDNGVLSPASPLRRAYAHTVPTVLGMVAGSVTLLRNPYVVYGLGEVLKERTLFGHLVGIYETTLATIFGDTDTVAAIKRGLNIAHRRRYPANDQPDWFVETVGGRQEFAANEPGLLRAVFASITAATLKSHRTHGLVRREDIDGYVADLHILAEASGVSLGAVRTMDDLDVEAAPGYLMQRDMLNRVGVPDILNSLLATKLAPGTSLDSLAPMFLGFTPPANRQAFGMTWTSEDNNAVINAAGAYVVRASKHHDVATGRDIPVRGNDALTNDGLFTISNGRVLHA